MNVSAFFGFTMALMTFLQQTTKIFLFIGTNLFVCCCGAIAITQLLFRYPTRLLMERSKGHVHRHATTCVIECSMQVCNRSYRRHDEQKRVYWHVLALRIGMCHARYRPQSSPPVSLTTSTVSFIFYWILDHWLTQVISIGG
jgi:hypothetical protein